MDASQAVEDFSGYVEAIEGFSSFEELAGKPEAKLLSWLALYTVFKLGFRLVYGGAVWDQTSLVHNFLSIIVGLYDIRNWELEESDTCHSLSHRSSLVIALQLVHSVSDFVAFFPEMMRESVFIWHHVILIVTSTILPYCPGCYYVSFAYTFAEMGSASIAVDGEWRKIGKSSRGFKRVVVFGLSRVVNLYFLWKIYKVTPASTMFSLWQDDKEIVRVNFPICMITSVGGSFMILLVNGVTWFRMYKSFMKHRKRRMLLRQKMC